MRATIQTPLTLVLAWALLGPAAAYAGPDAAATPTPSAPPAAAAAGAASYRYPTRLKVDNGLLPQGAKAASAMAPFLQNDCGICHQSKDPKNPGPTRKPGNALCFACHEEFAEIMARAYVHPSAAAACTNCHNPHASTQKKLLHRELPAQCFECHQDMKRTVETAAVKHGALDVRSRCGNCHNPHGTHLPKLLSALPFDQCMACHSSDGLKDWNGVTLTNYQRQLEENEVWHKPVASKDCSGCHKPHGGANFRLLMAKYPPQFYAPYSLQNYALCYSCHNDKVVSVEETTKLTNFRDGTRNLHYVHVHKLDRRRTCRACHDVHAAKQPARVRDGVPFGKEGWTLSVQFQRTPTGGTCVKACHDAKSYVNKPSASLVAK